MRKVKTKKQASEESGSFDGITRDTRRKKERGIPVLMYSEYISAY